MSVFRNLKASATDLTIKEKIESGKLHRINNDTKVCKLKLRNKTRKKTKR